MIIILITIIPFYMQCHMFMYVRACVKCLKSINIHLQKNTAQYRDVLSGNIVLLDNKYGFFLIV